MLSLFCAASALQQSARSSHVTSQKASKLSEPTMPTVTAYTRSHENTSSSTYKSMVSATTTSTPSTVVDHLHAAPRMSSSTRHHAAIGSEIDVESDREREVSVCAASSSAGTSVRSTTSNRIRPTGTRDGSVRSSRLSRTSSAGHSVSGGTRRSVSSRSQ